MIDHLKIINLFIILLWYWCFTRISKKSNFWLPLTWSKSKRLQLKNGDTSITISGCSVFKNEDISITISECSLLVISTTILGVVCLFKLFHETPWTFLIISAKRIRFRINLLCCLKLAEMPTQTTHCKALSAFALLRTRDSQTTVSCLQFC